jgi:hypothetical protein
MAEPLYSRLEDGRLFRMDNGIWEVFDNGSWGPPEGISWIEFIEAVPVDAEEIAALIEAGTLPQ